MVNIDQTDRQILNILQKNSKLTHREIAGQLHVTKTPVFDRIKKLERKGIIKRYVALLNPKKIEKGLTVLCFITLEEHGMGPVDQFRKEIEKNPKVMECYHIAGNYDFFLKVMVKDVDEYQSFVLRDLSEIKNISHVQSSFVLGELKYKLDFEL